MLRPLLNPAPSVPASQAALAELKASRLRLQRLYMDVLGRHEALAQLEEEFERCEEHAEAALKEQRRLREELATSDEAGEDLWKEYRASLSEEMTAQSRLEAVREKLEARRAEYEAGRRDAEALWAQVQESTQKIDALRAASQAVDAWAAEDAGDLPEFDEDMLADAFEDALESNAEPLPVSQVAAFAACAQPKPVVSQLAAFAAGTQAKTAALVASAKRTMVPAKPEFVALARDRIFAFQNKLAESLGKDIDTAHKEVFEMFYMHRRGWKTNCIKWIKRVEENCGMEPGAVKHLLATCHKHRVNFNCRCERCLASFGRRPDTLSLFVIVNTSLTVEELHAMCATRLDEVRSVLVPIVVQAVTEEELAENWDGKYELSKLQALARAAADEPPRERQPRNFRQSKVLPALAESSADAEVVPTALPAIAKVLPITGAVAEVIGVDPSAMEDMSPLAVLRVAQNLKTNKKKAMLVTQEEREMIRQMRAAEKKQKKGV